MVSSDRVATASTGKYALRFILVLNLLMIARLRLISSRLPGLRTRGEKLRAVIVIGFCLLASPDDKKSATTFQVAGGPGEQEAWILTSSFKTMGVGSTGSSDLTCLKQCACQDTPVTFPAAQQCRGFHWHSTLD